MADSQPGALLGYKLHITSDEVTRVAIEHAKAFGAKRYEVSSIVGHSRPADGGICAGGQ